MYVSKVTDLNVELQKIKQNMNSGQTGTSGNTGSNQNVNQLIHDTKDLLTKAVDVVEQAPFVSGTVNSYLQVGCFLPTPMGMYCAFTQIRAQRTTTFTDCSIFSFHVFHLYLLLIFIKLN
jgi:hypothetical protein